MRSALSAIVVGAMATASLFAQDRPDFSGRWILASPARPSADTPRAMSVRQTLATTNVRGEPMPAFFKEISIERDLVDGTRREKHAIGVAGGFVSGTKSSGVATNGPAGHYAVNWDNDALVFESGSRTETKSAERREVWSLDTTGRLHVTVTTRASSASPTTVTFVFRRQ